MFVKLGIIMHQVHKKYLASRQISTSYLPEKTLDFFPNFCLLQLNILADVYLPGSFWKLLMFLGPCKLAFFTLAYLLVVQSFSFTFA